jgi:hypothetical protein
MEDSTRIPEAQIAISPALWLIQEGIVRDTISVSIDRAMVRVQGIEILEYVSFVSERRWNRHGMEEQLSGSFLRSGSTNCCSGKITA